MQFTKGEQLNHNRYEIIKAIGGGGFGIAYLAQDHRKNCQVVIKTLNKLQLQTVHRNEPDFDLYFDEVLQQSFLTEIITLASFDHPHIVKIYKETFKHKGLQCMIMDYIDGETLDDCLARKGLFSEAEALKVIQEIGSALDYIHSKNYLHRDVKPQNILLRKTDNKAILIDFGIAREVDFTKTITLTATQTKTFAPPEQFESRNRYTPALDIYALAGTLYVLLAVYEPPFIPLPSPFLNGKIMLDMKMKINPPNSLNPNINQRINDAIMAGMELEAELRSQSMKQWFNLLGINLLGETSLPQPQANPVIAQPKPFLQGYFILPEMQNQGMVRRFGRGVINTVILVSVDQVIVCASGGAGLFNTNTGEAIWEIDCPAHCGAISADGKILALGHYQNIYLWVLTSGNFLREFSDHTNSVLSIAISNNNQWLVSSSWDNTVRLWDLRAQVKKSDNF